MATQQTTAAVYDCPKCTGVLSFADGSWECTECQYVPRQSAD